MTRPAVGELDLSRRAHLAQLKSVLHAKFPYFSGVIQRQYEEFGERWADFVEADLARFFGEDEKRLEAAVVGYGRFALDGMRLQREFDKTRRYAPKTHAQASREVYQNKEYMFSLYLPGIYLSHFLWRHHYRQHLFFEEKFLPLARAHGGRRFYDVGVGTGFYSREMLRCLPGSTGTGFDLSPFSLEHATKMVGAWGMTARYTPTVRDIIAQPVETPAPFIVNIEVLEHLEDPQAFLNRLCRMLEPGGYGLISAAVTAPNADHIYLYNNAQEVIVQLERAGLRVLDFVEDRAYEPRRPGESVPVNAAFIVTRP